jgi:hypothetical protein
MKNRILSLLFALIVLTVPFGASAQFTIPGGSDEINVYILKLYQFGFGIGGILAVLMIVIGGIYYSVSGAVDKKSEGKEMITSALLGLLILFGSYLILQTVNPVLLNLQNPAVPEVPLIESDCTAQDTTLHKCAPNETPLDPQGKCVCYKEITLSAKCPSPAFSSSGCLKKNLLMTQTTITNIPNCGSNSEFAFVTSLLSSFGDGSSPLGGPLAGLAGLFRALVSCSDSVSVVSFSVNNPSVFTPVPVGVFQFQWPVFPANKTPDDWVCVTYALRENKPGGRLAEFPLYGTRLCTP